MAECKQAPGCPYANYVLPLDLELSEQYANEYCFGNYDACARLKVFKALGKPNVPRDMYPDQHDVADILVKSIKSSWTAGI